MKISDLVTNLAEHEGFAEKLLARLKHLLVPRSGLQKCGANSCILLANTLAEKYRREKPDLKVLLEKKTEDYVGEGKW